MTNSAIIDPNIQQRRASNPENSVWVSASAGSGKTKVLTDRVLSLLLTEDDPHPERILCITFTKAAAAEMANRLNTRLGKWSTMDEADLVGLLEMLLNRPIDDVLIARARRLFAKVLDTPGGLKIQTVHSFCQSLLGRFPLEAELPPHFEVMDDRTAGEMMQRARDIVLRTADREGGKLASALQVITRRVQEDQFAELMRVLSSERGRLKRFRDGVGGLEAMVHATYICLDAEKGRSEADILTAACDDSLIDVIGLRKAVEILLTGTEKSDQPAGEKLAHWLTLDKAKRIDNFSDYRLVFLTTTMSPRSKVMTKKLADTNPQIEDILLQEQARLVGVQEAICKQVTAEATEAMLVLGEAMLCAYELEKQARAQLDYDDLILKARDLITGEGSSVPWILYKLDGGLDHILIDEAQDTNPEQWDVISALADEFFAGSSARDTEDKGQRTVFAVGDVKQSIYSFQRADPQNFIDKQYYFEKRAKQAALGWDAVPMDVSFRSTNAVLGAVDAVFKTDEAKDGLVTADDQVHHHAFRAGHAGHVEVWPLVAPEKPEDPMPWDSPVNFKNAATPELRLAKTLAAQISSWIGTEDLPAKGRKICAGDVLILVRRRTKFVDFLVRELKALDVPVAGVDRMVLSQQIAVQDLIQLGHFLCLPEDDLALATILKSPLLGLNDDDLFNLAHRRDTSLWQRLRDLSETDDRYMAAHIWLQKRLSRVDYARPFELFAEILSELCPVPDKQGQPLSGRQAMVARLGTEAEDPIDEFLNLALSFEQSNIPSLQSFLRWFDVGTAEIKRDLESVAKDEVRIMTVHGAKGIQAPVVILPDTVSKPSGGGNRVDIQWVRHGGVLLPVWTPKAAYQEAVGNKARLAAKQAENQEYRRLLYVAMTRAEDRLYVCGYLGHRNPADDNWFNLISRGLDALATHTDMDFSPLCSDGWQGEGLVLSEAQTVDAEVDDNNAKPVIIVNDYPDWMFRKPGAEPMPPKPLMPSQPVSEDPPVHSPLSKGGNQLYKRGILTHKLLQSLPDLTEGLREISAKRFLSLPIHGLSDSQQHEILTETMAVLKHPDFAPLFGQDSRAEVPIVGLIESESSGAVPFAVSGQIDRLYIADDQVFIIDYKTLRPSPKAIDTVPVSYLRQLAGYTEVLEKIYPDHKVRAALLWTEEARLMEISKDLLDPYRVHP